MTISMHQSSVGVFTHFLDSLSGLLDHASAHAEKHKIDSAILLNARLYPNMYNFTRQVGETNRHAVLACALLAGVNPPGFTGNRIRHRPTQGADRERKGFRGEHPAGPDRWHRGKGSNLYIPQWYDEAIHRSIVAADLQRAAILLSSHNGLRHLATLRR